jgi:LacI family transcriptional regulator
MPPTRKRPTIYDLAKAAKVSPGTVSRVLNNKDRVKASTRDRVLQIAKDLGMKPQSSARTTQIAIVNVLHEEAPFMSGGYTSELTMRLSFQLAEKNIGVFIPSNPMEQLKGYFLDGIIALLYNKKGLHQLHNIQKGVPVVSMDNFFATEEQYVVSSDHYESGKMAARYLIKKGKKRLAFAGSAAPSANERKQGFVDEIRANGLAVEDNLICQFKTKTNMHSEIARIVRGGADSLFVPGSSQESIIALHILQYIMGLKVPDDISFIGGENEGISENLTPPVTSFKVPLQEMAESAVDLIIRLIEGENIAQTKHTFSGHMIERDSVSFSH